jgi:hypothetical protein
MFIIFDLDGTLSDHSKRIHHVTKIPPNFTDYYNKCDEDEPHKVTLELFHQLVQLGNRVEIWTGRTDRVKDKTLQKLLEWGIAVTYLTRMRQEGDFSPDYILKGKWLQEELALGNIPDLIFEDRTRMVEFWRNNNITCYDVGDIV